MREVPVGTRSERPWRIRTRLVVVVAVAATAPTVAIAYWVVNWLTEGMTFGTAVLLVIAWTTGVAIVASAYGVVAARRLVGPLEALTEALYRFDPSLGDVGHPSLREEDDEPVETKALKRALRAAVERIARDRAQKEALLAGLMHDLKTPLVAQGLLVEQLNKLDTDRRLEVLHQLERSSFGAVARLNRLIDVLRVDAAPVRSTTTVLHVRDVVREAIEDLAPLIDARGIEVRVSGEWQARLDRAGALRAIENVVANGMRHARTVVHVTVHAGLVEVADDGPGFDVPFDEAVDPFRPGPASDGRTVGTAGLGLYIARRSLEAMGGRLKLAATGPRGSKVLLYLGTEAP